MTALLDAREVAASVKAAVTAELGRWSAYDHDEVPGTHDNPGPLPYIFALVSVERRYNPQVRQASQRTTRTGWRVNVQSLGRSVDECRWAMTKVSVALNEARLVVDGAPSSVLLFESDEAPQFDDGKFVGRSAWTFAL